MSFSARKFWSHSRRWRAFAKWFCTIMSFLMDRDIRTRLPASKFRWGRELWPWRMPTTQSPAIGRTRRAAPLPTHSQNSSAAQTLNSTGRLSRLSFRRCGSSLIRLSKLVRFPPAEIRKAFRTVQISDKLAQGETFDANGKSGVDGRPKISRDQPIGTHDSSGFRPCYKYWARSNGAAIDGPRRVHRNRHRHHPGKEAAKSGMAGSDLFRRARFGPSDGLEEAGNPVSNRRKSLGRRSQARHRTQRGKILLRRGHFAKNGRAFLEARARPLLSPAGTVTTTCNSTTLPLHSFRQHVISGAPHGGPLPVAGSWDVVFLPRWYGDACAEAHRSVSAWHDDSAFHNSANHPPSQAGRLSRRPRPRSGACRQGFPSKHSG